MAHETDRHRKARALLHRTGHKAGAFHHHETNHEDDSRDKAIADREVRKAIAQHDRQLHGEGKHTRLKLARGGSACEGLASGGRLDRGSRGKKGAKSGGTKVNVLVMPPRGGPDAMGNGLPTAGAAPMPPRPMPPAAPPMAPPRPPMGAPGMPPGGGAMPPGGMPPGGMPPGMMRKAGGRAHHASGGKVKRHHRDMGGPAPMAAQNQMQGGMGQGLAPPQSGPMPAAGMQPQNGQQPSPQQIQMMRARMAQQRGVPQGQPMPAAKRGGRAKHADGGKAEVGPGRVEGIRGGAGGGLARIEKSEAAMKERRSVRT